MLLLFPAGLAMALHLRRAAPLKSRQALAVTLGTIVAALIFGAVGCKRARVPRDELVFLMEQPAATIDPRYAVGAYDFKIGRLVYAPLVSVDTATLDRVARRLLEKEVIEGEELRKLMGEGDGAGA